MDGPGRVIASFGAVFSLRRDTNWHSETLEFRRAFAEINRGSSIQRC